MDIKLALHFICKNESHCILDMLNSCKSIVDLIIANDTGSTDGTQDIIRKFGEDNNIPTYVVERPFDTYEKSRNYAMDTLRDVAKNEMHWDLDKVFGFWFDCDETAIIGEKFNKEALTKDFYSISAFIDTMEYTRNTFFRLSKAFRWYGPIHEFIVCDDKDIQSDILPSDFIKIDVKMIGDTWKGDIPKKYKGHALLLEDYLETNKEDPRWIFYAAQSWHDAATLPDNKVENEERLRRSLYYYKERVRRIDGYFEEIYYSQYRIGELMKLLEYGWNETMTELLKAYSMDNIRGEAIFQIIDHYMSQNDFNIAYIFSKFAVNAFHGKNPFPSRILFINPPLYNWRFLDVHCICSLNSGHREEASVYYQQLIDLTKQHPDYFTKEDLNKIEMNRQFFIFKK